jgi:preprotein translocase subunit SecA
VDDFTGRLMPGRRWSDGLHQAVEAKEGVLIENENQTLASVTFQNYFRMYKKLAGMTGTADTESVEFKKIYNLDVVVIPTNKNICRIDQDDLIYKDISAKYKAIAEEVKKSYDKQQPVLVGTVSIEKSEKLSALLKRHNVPHNVLNAKHHEREAEIVAQAGRPKTVTIATNMAGRGTDILLGGNPDFLAKSEVAEEDPSYPEVLKKFQEQTAKEKATVIAAGGLFIIGTERHESRRIDNQLRGRAGRQGDPGQSRFYLSLEDDLFRIFGGDRIKNFMGKSMEDDEPVEHSLLSRQIANAQKRVEGHNFDIRKHLLQYDDVMNMQRKIIYGMRKEVLKSEADIGDLIQEFMYFVADGLAADHYQHKRPIKEWNIEELDKTLRTVLHPDLSIKESEITESSEKFLAELLYKKIQARYDLKKAELGDFLKEIEKMFTLSSIDQHWKEHLGDMDHLREGIGLRGYAQKDPLLEYKKESFEMFKMLDAQLKQEVITKILNVRLQANQEEQQIERFEEKQRRNTPITMSHGDESAPTQQTRVSSTEDKMGRNDVCWCGSGKKFKKCHGR